MSWVGNDLNTAINSSICGKCIIFYGIIKKVLADNVIVVAPAVVADKSEYFETTCYLCQMSNSEISMHIVPKENDKVLVFSPKTYIAEMFKKDYTTPKVVSTAFGYSPYACIAIYCNYQQNDLHHNTLTVTENALKLLLAYSEADSTDSLPINNICVETFANGDISVGLWEDKDNSTADKAIYKFTLDFKEAEGCKLQYLYDADNEVYGNVVALTADGLSTQIGYNADESDYNSTVTLGADGVMLAKNIKLSCTMTAEGALNVQNEKVTASIAETGDLSIQNEKVIVTAGNDGTVSIDNGSTTIEIAADGKLTVNAGADVTVKSSAKVAVEATGKLSVKGGGIGLKDILDGICDTIAQLKTVGSPASQAADPSTVMNANKIKQTQIAMCME